MRDLVTIAWDWGCRCFGAAHMNNTAIRALRTAEEVVELAQALRVPEDQMHLLITKVYQRPAGEPIQEIGGSMVTLMCLCRSMSVDPEAAFLTELRRCLAKDPAYFAQRNRDKIDLGLSA